MGTVLENPPWWSNQDQQQQAAPDINQAADPNIPPWHLPDYKPAPPAPATAAAAAASDAYNHPETEAGKYFANAITGLQNAGPALIGLPHSLGQLGDYIGTKLGASDAPGFLTRHTYSPEEVDSGLYTASNAFNRAVGLPEVKPYKAETGLGQFGQDVLTGVPLAAVGGGGLPALAGRQLANLGGVASTDVARKLYPDSPGVQLVTGLLGSVLGDRAIPTAGWAGSNASRYIGQYRNTEKAATTAAAEQFAKGAQPGVTDIPSLVQGRTALINTIDQNLPNWTFPGNSVQPAPGTATVTMNPALQGMTYRDMPAAERAGNPVYRNNASQTNVAQREAVSRVTPDISSDITNARNDITNLTGALPIGVTAQDAGTQFRGDLQSVYDQRKAAQRAVGNNVYAPLETSTAQINFQPLTDYVTTQVASNAGEVGQAYSRALDQFKTPSGITLDHPRFAQSVLSALGDLADSYPPGSAAAHAVLDVKRRADSLVGTAEPAVAQAQQAYAAASRPLDIFDPARVPGPIADAVQKKQFGDYTMSNDAVTSQFLKSNGSADAIDKLNSVFGDVKTATQPLQDFIASQVQQHAMNPDGTVNLTAMNRVIAPYQPALNKLPFSGLRQQFADVTRAQTAVDQLAARQNIYDNFVNGLGVRAEDQAGHQFYSLDKFDKFLTNNRPAVESAYGQAGTATLDQVNRQLKDAYQIAATKVPGQSGTPQALQTGSDNIVGFLVRQAFNKAGGAVLGGLPFGATGALVGEAGGNLVSAMTQKKQAAFNTHVEEIMRNALADPVFARSLLTKYNPKMPTTKGRAVLNYVQNRLGGVVAPAMSYTVSGSPD